MISHHPKKLCLGPTEVLTTGIAHAKGRTEARTMITVKKRISKVERGEGGVLV